MDENKNHLVVLSIVAIVAIVGLSFLFMARGNANYAGKASEAIGADENLAGQASIVARRVPQIKATSCDADGTCEMNDALVQKTIFSGPTSNLYLRPGSGTVVVDGNSLIVSSLTFDGKTISTPAGSGLFLQSGTGLVTLLGSSLAVEKSITTPSGSTSNLFLTSDNKNVVVDGSLTVKNTVAEVNNDYPYFVCADFSGKLITSKKPCN